MLNQGQGPFKPLAMHCCTGCILVKLALDPAWVPSPRSGPPACWHRNMAVEYTHQQMDEHVAVSFQSDSISTWPSFLCVYLCASSCLLLLLLTVPHGMWNLSSPVKVKVAQVCWTLCDPMVCIVHGIFQARILKWVAFPFSRGSFQLRDQTQVSHIAG